MLKCRRKKPLKLIPGQGLLSSFLAVSYAKNIHNKKQEQVSVEEISSRIYRNNQAWVQGYKDTRIQGYKDFIQPIIHGNLQWRFAT